MTTYKTGNPIGSTDPKDLYDNAENLDEAVNTRTAESWDDRFGVARKTWWGMEKDFQQFLINSGYENIGDYAAGLEITARNQIFWRDGELYRAGAVLELPYTTTGDWGSEEGLFVAVGDAALRQELADTNKGALIVKNSALAVDHVDDLLSLVSSPLIYPGLRVYVNEPESSGYFVWSDQDESASVSQDPHRSIYVANGNGSDGAWVRQYDGPYQARWSGQNLNLIPSFITGDILLGNGSFSGSNGSVNRPDRFFISNGDSKINGLPLKKSRHIGNVLAPSGFPWQPPVIITEKNGIYEADIDIDSFEVASKMPDHVTYYVDIINGDQANDGFTPDNPVESIKRAIGRAISGGVTNLVVYIKSGVYRRDTTWPDDIFQGNLTVICEDDVYITQSLEHDAIVWTPMGDGVYRTSSDNLSRHYPVIDFSVRDRYGKPATLLIQQSLSEVAANPGSFYHQGPGGFLYIKTFDSRAPDDNLLTLSSLYESPTQANGSNTLFIRNAKFVGGKTGSFVTGLGVDAVAVFDGCDFTMASNGSGITVEETGLVITRNCNAYNNFLDGFNYHSKTTSYAPKALEINCKGWWNGLHKLNSHGPQPHNSNGTSAHENYIIARVNFHSWENCGPNIVDIGDGYSWNVGCKAFDSIATEESQRGDFLFTTGTIKAWLEGCESGLTGYQLRQGSNSVVKVKDWFGGLSASGTIGDF